MLSFRLRGVRIRLYFGFFAMLTFYFYLHGRDTAAVGAALVCCLLHELGHLAMMFACGYAPKALCFYAGGIKLVPRDGIVPRGKQAVILSAGCAVNLLLAGASMVFGLGRLVYVNLAIALINLLPLNCLDGGRLLALFMPEKRRRLAAVLTVLPVCCLTALASPPAAVMLAAFSAAAELLM